MAHAIAEWLLAGAVDGFNLTILAAAHDAMLTAPAPLADLPIELAA